MKSNQTSLHFNSAAIRHAIQTIGIDLNEKQARNLLQHVKDRVESGERYCHICFSAENLFGENTYAHLEVTNFFEKLDVSVMEDKCKELIINYDKYDPEAGSDQLRIEFLRILVDIKRNRKGSKKPKFKVGDRVVVTSAAEGTGGNGGVFFRVGDTGTVVSVYEDKSTSVEFDNKSCKQSDYRCWSVDSAALKHLK